MGEKPPKGRNLSDSGKKKRAGKVAKKTTASNPFSFASKIPGHIHAAGGLFSDAPHAMLLVDSRGVITDANRAACDFLERPVESLVGLPCGDAFDCVNAPGENGCGGNSPCRDCFVRNTVNRTLEGGAAFAGLEGKMHVRRNGSQQQRDWTLSSSFLRDNRKRRVLLTLADNTERGRMLLEREITIDLLHLLNSGSELHDLIREVTRLMQTWSGCEAVGIRLRDGEDFPYFETRGFPQEFVEAENRLCAVDQKGELIRDSSGNPVIECMCGNILCGRFDASKPFFTKHGSFWTSCTTDLLASTSEKDRQARTRNRCNGQGYESVALIPLRTADETFGLMQFNDRRRGCLNSEFIGLLERLGDSIAIALAQRKARESLHKSERKYQNLFENMQQGAFIQRADGAFLDANPAALDIFGLTREELLSRNPANSSWDVLDEKEAVLPFGELPSRKALRTGRPVMGVTAGIYNDRKKTRVWVEINAIPEFRPGEEKPYQVMVTMHDITGRNRAENAIRESEERYRALVENIGLGVTRISADYQILAVNSAHARLFGKTTEDLIGKHCYREFAKRESACLNCPGSMALATGKPVECETENVRDDGKSFSVRLQAFPLFDASGKSEGFIEVVEDITQRKKTEKELREIERDLESAQSLAKIGFWRWNLLDDTAVWSKETYRIFERSEDDINRHRITFLDMIHPDDRSRVGQALTDAIEGRNAYNIEYRVPMPDGRVKIIHAKAEVVHDKSDRAILMRGSVQDITERKQTRQALELSRQKMRLHFEQTRLGVIEWDEKFEVREWNASAERIFGYSRREALGRHYMFIVPENERDRVKETGDAVVQQRGGWRLANENVTKDGRIISCEWFNTPLVDAFGKTIGVASVVEDVTEKRRMEAQYRQAQKMEAVGRLAAGVAHDFNNQLTVIQGYCEMLLDACPPGDPMHEPLSQILQAARRSQSTTSHLLSFSRRHVLKPEVVVLSELLQEMRGPVSRMIGEDIAFKVISVPGLPNVLVDKSALQQAIMNLIINARDAMPKGGELTLHACRRELTGEEAGEYPAGKAGSWVMLELNDTGIGMDRRTLERIYDPFYTTKEVGKGTGLGVPMVQGFISQSEGFMGFRSRPGKGTTVQLFLPPTALTPSDVEKTRRMEVKAVTKTVVKDIHSTVLVVEDEEGVRNLMVTALENCGYNTLQASRPVEAIVLSDRYAGAIDLLVTDVVMPEMKGDELARQLKNRRNNLRTLFVTGYTTFGTLENSEVLLKPFNTAELLERVHKVLDGRCV